MIYMTCVYIYSLTPREDAAARSANKGTGSAPR